MLPVCRQDRYRKRQSHNCEKDKERNITGKLDECLSLSKSRYKRGTRYSLKHPYN